MRVVLSVAASSNVVAGRDLSSERGERTIFSPREKPKGVRRVRVREANEIQE